MYVRLVASLMQIWIWVAIALLFDQRQWASLGLGTGFKQAKQHCCQAY